MLKLAQFSKKKQWPNKENYKPVSVLSHMSKVFERFVYNQIDNFMKDKLSNLLTGFRKNQSTTMKESFSNEEKKGIKTSWDYSRQQIEL